MDYIKRYRKIVNNFIKKDFPSLQGKKIIIKEEKAKWRAHVNYYPWGMRLYISEKLRKFPLNSIKRIIFHELCHLEIFKEQGLIKTNVLYLLYMRSPKIRKKVEAEANILMIKKGHWKEVMTARRGNIKRGLDYALTEKEIKYYMKKFNVAD
jgi:hypothetical protein